MKSYLSSLVPPAFRLSIFSIKSFLCDVEAGTSRFFWQLSTSVLYSNHLFWKKKRTKQQLGRWVLFKLYSRLGNPSAQHLSLAQMVRCPCHQRQRSLACVAGATAWRKNGRARRRYACLLRPLSLWPTTSKHLLRRLKITRGTARAQPCLR